MKILSLIILFAIGTNAVGQSTGKIGRSPTDFVPAGYVVTERILGDLNEDNEADYVLIIKATDKDKFVADEKLGKIDRNRRGVIIALRDRDRYELALENRSCFSSENEDGGVYYAPELDVTITKGKLLVHYAHGRYGSWNYSFQFRNSSFELIGYDSSSNRGPVVESSVSINLLTRKMRVRKNANPQADSGEEKFLESWKTFALKNPILLSDIKDFDAFAIDAVLGFRK